MHTDFFFLPHKREKQSRMNAYIKTEKCDKLNIKTTNVHTIIHIHSSMMMFLVITFAIIYYISYRLYKHFVPSPNIDPNGKYVLISGCDTGFGHGLAVELDKQGFNVLAGVLLDDNVTSLKNELSPKATVFRLDITKQEDIDAAFDLVNEKTKVLHALVNNAGINAGGYIDWTSLEIIRKVMDVNFFGHVAMTKKFLPLLIAKRDARVVNTCSICGYLTVSSSISYCSSKHALESFSDCLRREMAPWGLRVSIVEPGAMRTMLFENRGDSIKSLWGALSSDAKDRWGVDFFNDVVRQIVDHPLAVSADNPMKVVRVMQHAVMNTNPRIRYRPGWQSKLTFLIVSITPVWLLDKLLTLGARVVPAGVRNQLMT
jgi:11-cis-retinol dehydrogenase